MKNIHQKLHRPIQIQHLLIIFNERSQNTSQVDHPYPRKMPD